MAGSRGLVCTSPVLGEVRRVSARRTVTVLLLLLLSQLLCACVRQDAGPAAEQPPPYIRGVAVHGRLSESTARDEVPTGVVPGVLGIGFVRPEHRAVPPFERPQTEEFRLQSDEPFAPFLILLNNSADPAVFLVTVLLDYRQVAFQLDGQEAVLHEVSVPASTELELPMCVEVGAVGVHDLQAVAFADPYNLTLDVDDRQLLRFGRVYARRAVVAVGDVTVPARVLEALDMGTPMQQPMLPGAATVEVVRASEPVSDTVHPYERRLYVDGAFRGQTYPFEAWVANETEGAGSFAMVAFFDYHQISLNGQELLAVYLEPGEEATLSAELVVPQEPGVHQLQIVWLLDPYRSVLRDEVASPFVYASARVAIDVQWHPASSAPPGVMASPRVILAGAPSLCPLSGFGLGEDAAAGGCLQIIQPALRGAWSTRAETSTSWTSFGGPKSQAMIVTRRPIPRPILR